MPRLKLHGQFRPGEPLAAILEFVVPDRSPFFILFTGDDAPLAVWATCATGNAW